MNTHEYLTEAAAAAILGVGPDDVRRYIKSGRLRGKALAVSREGPGGRRAWRKEYRIRPEWLAAFVEAGDAGPTGVGPRRVARR